MISLSQINMKNVLPESKHAKHLALIGTQLVEKAFDQQANHIELLSKLEGVSSGEARPREETAEIAAWELEKQDRILTMNGSVCVLRRIDDRVVYEIPKSDLYDAEKVIEWLQHLYSKGWFTRLHARALIDAHYEMRKENRDS